MPAASEMLDILSKAGLPAAIFSDIKSNPVGGNVEAGLKVFKDGGHDGVIAFGGGSGLDTGKAIAFMAGQTRPIWDFEDIGGWPITRSGHGGARARDANSPTFLFFSFARLA